MGAPGVSAPGRSPRRCRTAARGRPVVTCVRVSRWSALRRATSTWQGTWDASACSHRSGTVPGMPDCSGPATVVFDKSLTEYDFGPAHPMSPIRVDLTMRLADELGVLDHGLRRVPAPIADEARIATVHDPRLIEAVVRAGTTPGVLDEEFGLGTDDNPTFRDMHHAAAHVVGATVEAFRQVWTGESLHSVSIAGGLHHAMRDRASG